LLLNGSVKTAANGKDEEEKHISSRLFFILPLMLAPETQFGRDLMIID
jgi:hypothetical protein